MLGIVPGMRVAAPRDATRLREELGEALDVDDGPTAIRFPKGDVGEDIPALERRVGRRCARGAGRRVEPRRAAGGGRCVRVDGVGGGQATAQPGHRRDGDRPALGAAGVRGVRELAVQHKLVVTLEDNGVNGGVGSAVSAALRRRGDRRALPRRRTAAGVLRARVARRGAGRPGAHRPGRGPPDHRLGCGAGRLRRSESARSASVSTSSSVFSVGSRGPA